VKRFAALFERIDRTTSTNEKVGAMADYFRASDEADAAWALFFLTGLKLKRVLPAGKLGEWAREWSGIPDWLFRECYSTVGDFAELVCLLMPDGPAEVGTALSVSEWVTTRLERLRSLPPREQRDQVREWVEMTRGTERFLLLKMVTGSLRVGVSRTLVERGIAKATGLDPAVVAHRLSGDWAPTAAGYRVIVAAGESGSDRSKPYPFYLASPLEELPEALGPIEDWQLEWKWDGIRAQIIRRDGVTSLWSRGDERLTERFPEILEGAARLDSGTVVDGEILAWRNGGPLPFAALQRRIGRTSLSKGVLNRYPVAFCAYDLMEHGGVDVRGTALIERRRFLEALVQRNRSLRIVLSEVVRPPTWSAAGELRSTSRAKGVEGLMLKRLTSVYGVGRTRGDWWKWKIDPLSVDCVLTLAEPGHGRRANLLTDYTFAVWDNGHLVPFAKAYSGLTDEEIGELDRWIRQHTTGRYGPARVVEPVRVYELGFEGIQRSSRHRSGVAVRFPRILRIRGDKRATEADTLESLRRLIPADPDEEPGLFDGLG